MRWRRKRWKRARRWGCARTNAPRDSPRLFAEKYAAINIMRVSESSARARCHYGGWLNGIWNRRPLTRFRVATHPWGRERISTSWNLLRLYNPFRANAPEPVRDFESCDRPIVVSRVSLSSQPNPRRSRSRLLFLQTTAAFRRTHEFKELESILYIERRRSSM